MRGLLTAPAMFACLLLAACGGNSGNTTIINNNQTTVTTAGSTTTSAATTTTTAPTTSTTLENPVDPQPKPQEPKPGPVRCGETGVVTGGSLATTEDPAKPGFFNLEAENETCPVAISIAAAWTNEWEPQACAAGCVKVVGDMHCRYAGSGSGVTCQGTKSSLTFEIAFPD